MTSEARRELSTGARVTGFVVALVVLFGVGFGVGRLVGPSDPPTGDHPMGAPSLVVTLPGGEA